MDGYDPKREALYHPERSDSIFHEESGLSDNAVCAELSRLAYIRFEKSAADLQRLDLALAAGGFEQADPFSNEGTEGFATLRGNCLYIAFRGTQSDDPVDLAADADFKPIAWQFGGGGNVHQGFERALDKVWKRVGTILNEHLAAQVFFTGHSLGGALATLALSRANRQGAWLITFGSPRVGDVHFSSTFDIGHVIRFVHCCDLVTDVPPTALHGYTHIAAQTYIDRHGALHVREAEGTPKIDADRSAAWRHYLEEHAWKWGNVAVRHLADHAPVNYIRVLV